MLFKKKKVKRFCFEKQVQNEKKKDAVSQWLRARVWDRLPRLLLFSVTSGMLLNSGPPFPSLSGRKNSDTTF